VRGDIFQVTESLGNRRPPLKGCILFSLKKDSNFAKQGSKAACGGARKKMLGCGPPTYTPSVQVLTAIRFQFHFEIFDCCLGARVAFLKFGIYNVGFFG